MHDHDPRATTGVHARAAAVAPAPVADPVAAGLASALRHLHAANASAALMAGDLAEARDLAAASAPELLAALARVEACQRRVAAGVALALCELTASAER